MAVCVYGWVGTKKKYSRTPLYRSTVKQSFYYRKHVFFFSVFQYMLLLSIGQNLCIYLGSTVPFFTLSPFWFIVETPPPRPENETGCNWSPPFPFHSSRPLSLSLRVRVTTSWKADVAHITPQQTLTAFFLKKIRKGEELWTHCFLLTGFIPWKPSKAIHVAHVATLLWVWDAWISAGR